MITAKEINTFSENIGVPATTVDKDWVLGHLLAGIYKNSSCENEWFNSLSHHLKDTPSFDSVVLDLRGQLNQENVHGAF